MKNWIPKKEKIEELLDPNIAKENEKGTIKVVYQNNINSFEQPLKCGRSFEEAFIIDNHQYIFDNKNNLDSIKKQLTGCTSSDDVKSKSYEIQDFIDTRNKKKTEFAFDLLSHDHPTWEVPTYIKEGLVWLAK